MAPKTLHTLVLPTSCQQCEADLVQWWGSLYKRMLSLTLTLLSVIGRHLRFSTYPDIGQYCHLSPRVARARKQGCIRRNFVPMLYASWDIGTSGLKDAILGFLLPVRFHNNTDSPIGLLDFENIVLAVGISFLSCLQADIEVFPVWEAAILDFSVLVKSYNIPGSSIG